MSKFNYYIGDANFSAFIALAALYIASSSIPSVGVLYLLKLVVYGAVGYFAFLAIISAVESNLSLITKKYFENGKSLIPLDVKFASLLCTVSIFLLIGFIANSVL